MKLTPWDPDIKSIVDRIIDEDIDLQPDFQRQEVWTPTKKRKLIDTILRGWSIPPIHLVVTKDGQMDVLDGQQRLATIRDFVSNKLKIDGSITPYDHNINALDGLYYRNLPINVKRSIDQYSLRCFRITDYLPDEPSELFYRLNQPTMLTAGEQRNALYGLPREQLKDLVREFEELGNDKNNIGFSNARLAYDDVFARIVYFIERGSFSIKGTEALISERFRENKGFTNEIILRVKDSIRLFAVARAEQEKWRFNKASLSSLLLFYSRFSSEPSDRKFLSSTLGESASNLHVGDVSSAIDTFKDRASLRVTDVSSVVLRDVSLWYCYYRLFNKPMPKSVNVDALRSIQTVLRREPCDFEEAASLVIDFDAWGSSI